MDCIGVIFGRAVTRSVYATRPVTSDWKESAAAAPDGRADEVQASSGRAATRGSVLDDPGLEALLSGSPFRPSPARALGGSGMKCPRCQHESAADAVFCQECGARLEVACPACGTANQLGAKFCKKCGQAVSAASSAPVVRPSPES